MPCILASYSVAGSLTPFLSVLLDGITILSFSHWGCWPCCGPSWHSPVGGAGTLPPSWLAQGVWSHSWGPTSGPSPLALDFAAWTPSAWLSLPTLREHQVALLWEGKGFIQWAYWHLIPYQPGTRGSWLAGVPYSRGISLSCLRLKQL